MEQVDSSNFLTRSLQKYRSYILLQLRSKPKLTPKCLIFMHIFSLLQILSLIFSPEKDLNLPWNYSSLSYIWIIISLATRLDYLALFFNFIHLWLIICSIIWCYIITKVLIVYNIQLKEHGLHITNQEFCSKFVRKYVISIHQYCSFVLFSLPMSMIQALLSMPRNMGVLLDSNLAIVISAINILAYILMYIEDTLFIQKLSWIEYKRSEIVSSVNYMWYDRVLFIAINFSVAYVKYEGNSLVYSGIMCVIGASRGFLFAVKMPYAEMYRNILAGFEGVLLSWGGFVLFLAVISGYTVQDSYLSTLVYFIPIGFILYIYKECIYHRYNKLINTTEYFSSTQIFHILLAISSKSHLSSQPLANLIQSAVSQDPSNSYLSLWLAYFMLINEELNPAKALISTLTNSHSILLSIYISQLREDYYTFIHSSESERESCEYIFYISYYSKVLEANKQSAEYQSYLYNDLLSSNQDSRSISIGMVHFYRSIMHTRSIFRCILSVFDKNPAIYELYAGYLDVVEHSPYAKEELMKACKYKQDIIRKEETKELDSIYLISSNLVAIVSAEAKSLGDILDVKNSAELGYNDSELQGENVSIIFPPGIYYSYITQLRGLYNIWNSDASLRSSEECYLVRDLGYLVHVVARNNVINLDNGELAVILAIKGKSFGQDLAILDEQGSFMVSYVIDM
jgi:hypothetical protein